MGFGLVAGFLFAADASAPKTDSFNALAGVKRSRVRAGILICAPVVGFRPMRAASLRLAKNAQTRQADRTFLLQLTHHQRVKFIERQLRVLLADANGLKCITSCRSSALKKMAGIQPVPSASLSASLAMSAFLSFASRETCAAVGFWHVRNGEIDPLHGPAWVRTGRRPGRLSYSTAMGYTP